MKPLLNRPEYPFGTRLLVDLINAGELPMIAEADIEPQYGYVGRLLYADGTVRFFRNSNKGINNHGASSICLDKGYTKYFLRRLGYNVPDGRTILTSTYAALIDTNLSQYGEHHYDTPDGLLEAATSIGYPCVIKPNSMTSGGEGVFICYDADDVGIALQSMFDERVDVFLLEAFVPYADYRFVVFDGTVRLAYERRPLVITGDGQSTLREIIARTKTDLWAQDRRVQLQESDPRFLKKLRHSPYTLDDVLVDGDSYQVYDAANASLGGQVVDILDSCHEHWLQLAGRMAQEMGLRFCGIDLLCQDITRADAAYCVIEINASPGMANYATLGEKALARVRQLYIDMFRVPIR